MTENFFFSLHFFPVYYLIIVFQKETKEQKKKWHVAGQECQIGSWKPYPLLVRAKKADNHWQNILLMSWRILVWGEFKLIREEL